MHFVGWRNRRIPMFLEKQFNWSFQIEVQKSFILAPTSCRYTLAATTAHMDHSMKKHNSERERYCGQLALFLKNLFILPRKMRKSACHFGQYIDISDCMIRKKKEGRKKERKRARGKGEREREREETTWLLKNTVRKLQRRKLQRRKLPFYMSNKRNYKFHNAFYFRTWFWKLLLSFKWNSEPSFFFLNYNIWSKSLHTVIFLWKPTL